MTTTVSPPEALDEIKALFSWNPPRLTYKSPDASTASTATRRPFYHKHFSSKLVLKRVERLPSLAQDLAKNVDKALDAALKTLPSLDGLTTAKRRAYDVRDLEKVVSSESAVALFYRRTTGTYCSQVASTLALHPSASFSQWLNLLSWTQSRASPGRAFIDGLLRFRDGHETDGTWEAILETMESKNRRIFEEMGKSMSALATWEIKSPSAGTAEVMNAVLNLGKFSWPTCTASIASSLKHQKVRESVERVVGPDAQVPPWNFSDGSLNTPLVPENHDEEIDIQPLETLQQRVTRSAASGSSTLPPQPSASPSSERESPTKTKDKKWNRDDEEDEAYQHQHGAQILVQEAWAKAVRVDGTVIVLHSGNHEIVCVRHRGSQTFYVSDVIKPPTCTDPGYGKLQVGIYTPAIQETMDRKQQLSPTSQPKPPSDGGDLISGDKDQDDQDHDRGSGSGHKSDLGRHGGRHRGGHGVGERKSSGLQGLAGKKASTDDEIVAIEKASNRDVVLLYLQYGVYDSPVPATFIRSGPSVMARTMRLTPLFYPRVIRTYGLEECLTIVLTSEIGRGSTGVVHRGTLKPEFCDGTMPLDVVVKLAFHTFQREALRSEYEVYRHLRSKGVLQGIATVLGLFDDSEDCACALVMLYAGVPLIKKPQHVLSVSDCKSALSILESIHRAGILHGDIRMDNILMGDSGVTIIDFGHSKQCGNQQVKNKEFAYLRYILDLSH